MRLHAFRPVIVPIVGGFVVGAALLAHAPTALAATEMIVNFAPHPHGAPDSSTLEAIGDSIAEGALEAGWYVVERAPGDISLSITVRGKHKATVRVEFDEERVSLRYEDSVNLDYSPDGFTRRIGHHEYHVEGPRIHRNYNVWVTKLANRIDFRIAHPLVHPERGTSANPPLIADELEKLDKLRQRGVLTDAEFEHQKMKLLNR